MTDRPIPDATTTTCADHTPSPENYAGWHLWAEQKAKTHHQVRCDECGRYAIWKRGKKR